MPITIGSLDNVPAPGDPIRSPWAQEISGNVIHQFASTANRDAVWTSPPNGSVCVTLDTGTIWLRQAGVWVLFYPDQPRGIVAYKRGDVTSLVTLSTTPAEVWRLNNVPLKAGRLYTCTVTSRAVNRSAAGNIAVYTPSHVAIAGTSLFIDCIDWCDANYITFHWSERFTVTADSTYTVAIQASTMAAGTGVFYTDCGSGIAIEDIGPNRGVQ